MAERIEEPEAEAGGAPEQASPAAVALALGRAGKTNKAFDEDARAFLRKQSRLIDLQTEHLHEQRQVILSRLILGRWKDRVTLALQALTGVVGLVIAGAVAVMAWQAHQDHGAVIEAFSVPPEIAQRGLSGEVIANQLLDRLRELEADTVTGRPEASYANDWGGDIKVEIPETGVSIGELNRYLRRWLGSATRITGEVWRTPTGLALTARTGEASGKTFEGAETDLTSQIQHGAEAIYAGTQPYRYAVYLQTHGQPQQAEATFARLAASGPSADRPWAHAAWSTALLNQGDLEGAALHGREALTEGITSGYANLVQADTGLSHEEDILSAARLVAHRADKGVRTPELPDRAAGVATHSAIAFDLGDYQTAAAGFREFSDMGTGAVSTEGRAAAVRAQPREVEALALDHDVTAARRLLASLEMLATNSSFAATSRTAQVVIDQQMEDWRAAADHLEVVVATIRALGPASRQFVHRRDWSQLAVGYARLGRLPDAERMIAVTPTDCDDCLRARGEIAAIEHDRTGADKWFAAAARHAPSTPLAPTNWGKALLTLGDVDGAIVKLKEAHSLGPHFADPLELWGEALMRKGDLHGAAPKFAEADKYAPRWGRNHLRWGEALMLSGRYAAARVQYQAANGLDLSKPDRAALNVLLARTASAPLHG
ncbi:MAG TPA: hypothetical protein VIJ94_19260 [Caulobacteraceae bacterium]